jgi:hypothetical protein
MSRCIAVTNSVEERRQLFCVFVIRHRWLLPLSGQPQKLLNYKSYCAAGAFI